MWSFFYDVVPVEPGEADDLHSGGPVVPEGLEVLLVGLEVNEGVPVVEYVNGLPVGGPSRKRLIQATGEGDFVAFGVFDDAVLAVKDSRVPDGNLHFHDVVGDEPSCQFQVVSAEVVRLDEEQVFPVVGLLEGGLCLYLTVVECLEDIGADCVIAYEPYPAPVSDETSGSRGGSDQPLGAEGVGSPVVPDGFPEEWLVEPGDHVRAVAVVVDRSQVQVGKGHS